jgi:hypothetical protein
VPRRSSLEASTHFLRENYYSCSIEHEDCYQESSSLPKRVVDISKPEYRLVEPHSGTKDKYATLSYTWGDREFVMNTSESYESLKQGFNKDTVPVAFQEAASIALDLEIHYIWIDTLCIIQDSIVDWEEQAAKMGDIFEAAAITIAASASPNPDYSLFGIRDPMCQEIELMTEAHGDIVFKARRKIVRGIHAKNGRSLDTDPLDLRAWGLQEKMLSTRVIAFTGAELQWTCRTLKACECHQNSYPSQPLFPTAAGRPSVEERMKHSKTWSEIIEEYSARNLTYPTDTLPALSGLASKYGAVTGFTYVAGLWKESLVYDLVWQRHDKLSLPSPSWLGPSFSWVSASGAVNYRFARYSYPGARINHTKIVDLYYETTAHGVYGKASNCTLTIRGSVVAAHLRSSSHNLNAYEICIENATYSPNADQRAVCEFSIDNPGAYYSSRVISMKSECVTLGKSFNDTGQKIEEPITLLSLYSIHDRRYLYQNFLILAKSRRNDDSYERIGVGSGKLYGRGGSRNDIPSESWLVRSFEWLSVDFEERGVVFESSMEQTICLR